MSPSPCPRSRRRHRRVAAAVAPTALALFAAAPIALGGIAVAAQEATPAAIGVIESAENLAECAPSEIGAAPEEAAAEADTLYRIVAEESEARYRAQEELATVGQTEAIGRTQAIAGQILFDADGAPIPCSRFDVDLRTLVSDSPRRDNYLYNNTLETETYPLATFVLRAVAGLDGPLPDGEETTFTLIGDLSLHGATRLVAWETTASVDGETLEGTAATTFEMPDFAIEPPIVGPVVSLDERVALEVDLTARVAS